MSCSSPYQQRLHCCLSFCQLTLFHAADNHFLRLQDGRILNTFTHRSNMLDDDDAPLGLRAALSDTEGKSWDMSSDRIAFQSNEGDPTMAGWAPWYAPRGCACGYGNTIQLDDGALISVRTPVVKRSWHLIKVCACAAGVFVRKLFQHDSQGYRSHRRCQVAPAASSEIG